MPTDEKCQELLRKIHEVRAEVRELRRIGEEYRRETEELRRKKEEFQRETEEAQLRLERAKAREKEALEISTQKRTLTEYLLDCHYVFQKHTIAKESWFSSGTPRMVNGRLYPMQLRPWNEFTDTQRSIHYNRMAEILGDQQVFPIKKGTRAPTDYTDMGPGALFALKQNVRRIFEALIEVKPDVKREFGFSELYIMPARDELRVEVKGNKQPPKLPRTPPYGMGLRRNQSAGDAAAFVYCHKVAQKFKAKSIERALAKENLFMEVVQWIESNETTADGELKAQHKEDKEVAMTMAQAFNYMIKRGVAYGYVAGGKSLVLLHIKWDDLRTLYYHNCVVDEEGIKNKTAEVCYTAEAQLASFILLALKSEAFHGSALQALIKKAISVLKCWPNPSGEVGFLGASLLSWKTNIPEIAGAKKRKKGPSRDSSKKQRSSSDSSEEDDENLSNTDSLPTRQYCTQACLLGLKRGLDLDENCPNASSHRTVEGSCRHPINADELASLVGERLRQNPYRDCVAVHGETGSRGALFKIELAPYGYTFVGKGTQSAHLDCLQHESLVYSRLEGIQGKLVPVHLGIVDLAEPWGYLLPGEACVLHMMLMSWAGVRARYDKVPDLDVEVYTSWREVIREGIYCDESPLWNEERRRIMLFNFDRATIRPPLKHRQLSAVTGRCYRIKKIQRRRLAGVYKRSNLHNELRPEE